MRDFFDDDGRVKEARGRNLNLLEQFEFINIIKKVKTKLGNNIDVGIPSARNNDTTAFTWEVNGLNIEKCELNSRRILHASQEKEDYSQINKEIL